MPHFSDARITRIQVQGYRSLEKVTVHLTPLIVLVGPNGSGKSSFADVFVFLQQCLLVSPEAAMEERGGTTQLKTRTGFRLDTLSIDIDLESRAPGLFRGNYFVEFNMRGRRFSITKETCAMVLSGENTPFSYKVERGRWQESSIGVRPTLAPNRLALPLLSGTKPFAPMYQMLTETICYDLALNSLRRPQDDLTPGRLAADGSNAAILLKQIQAESPETAERVFAVMQRIMPNIQKIQAKRSGQQWTIEVTEEFSRGREINLEAISLSEGTLRLLGLLLALYALTPPSLLIMEEPEATLHPGAAAVLADVLQEAALRTQILITTHSPDLLAQFPVDSLRAVERIEGVTTIGPIASQQRQAVEKRLFTAGDIHRLEGLQPETNSIA